MLLARKSFIQEKVVLAIVPIIGIILSFRFVLPYAVSTILIYLLPGLYLDLDQRACRSIPRHFLFAIVVSIPFAIIADYIGTRSGLWYVPQSIFPWRFMGVIPYEDFLWMIAAVYVIVSLYGRSEAQDKRVVFMNGGRRFVFSSTLILIVFFILNHLYPALFVWHTPWAYAILGIILFLIPAIIWLSSTTDPIRKVLPIIGYFFYLTLLLEITGTHLGDWLFQGKYLFPMFAPFGLGAIPFEEFFFVGVVGPMAAIGLYEYFGCD
jgi:hypothetical protein